MIVCRHCGAEVFWSLPRAWDPCLECGEPIGRPSAAVYPRPIRALPQVAYLVPRSLRP